MAEVPDIGMSIEDVAVPGGTEARPSPKKITVVCDVCSDELLLRTSDGVQFHAGGEPTDGHSPVPRAAGK